MVSCSNMKETSTCTFTSESATAELAGILKQQPESNIISVTTVKYLILITLPKDDSITADKSSLTTT
jgi:hypothetical protein